ncbi:hypothetical protein NP493_119g08023 [Ridgeia piscesae]|uniref:DUF4708 domain-containing protein n=1 Tax=Ridgeia piscesae TaxID=27915 RepID=A0AAD9UH43_RIDPI|nr:hypothetical protein NP493_119g08023 [Ridgeia piscesae]
MHERNAELLYFADVPALHELCLVVVSVPTDCKLGSGKQPHIIRCRELIFTEQDILATPSLGHGHSVQIVMPQSLYKTGRLQSRFQKMGLQAEKPRRVTPAIFQSCYRYTLLAKLAPGWNKVGDYLVQGRDFVTTNEKMNAICLDVTVTEKEVCLAVQAHIIRSSPIQLADLGVCRPVWDAFTRDVHGKIAEYSICNTWCHILPSMKKGKIVNLVRQIPEDSPFKTYKDMKRYWKNTYGYRLPDTDEGMIYYQVYFKPIGNTLFTYPLSVVFIS